MNLDNNAAPKLEYKASRTIERYKMLEEHQAVLVGVSGGADSMALLSFLCSLREKNNIAVYAAHINHGLRGDEALRDERFVREWCAKNAVEFFVLHANVKEQAKASGETVEEAGRRVRYSFFEQKSKELKAAVATAHTLSDSIETQLLNYARGTGLRGMCGIPPVRGNIIRPLIRCTRRDTEEYCHYIGIKYVDDSTNFSRDYTRNRVRLDVVPKLYEINPSFDKAAVRLITMLEEDEKYLDDIAEKKLADARRGEATYDISVLNDDCPAAIMSRCVAIAAARFAGTSQEAKHIAGIIEIIEKCSGKIEIKSGCFANIRGGMLCFSRDCDKIPAKEEFTFPFCTGTYENIMYKLVISPIFQPNLNNLRNISDQGFKNVVDCDKIRGNALVRSRLQGDRFSPAGRNVTKTLKKLFNESKIPVERRSLIPVAVDNGGVLWVGGFGVSERCKVTQSTKSAILLEIKCLEV